MIELKGYTIDSSVLLNLSKVNDLIEFEGPVLSHFVDSLNRDYLFYWVDYNNECNRWLVWRISKVNLYRYIRGFSSLREILLSHDKDFIYSVDIDEDLSYKNVLAIDLPDMEQSYIPEEKSILVLDKSLNDFYKNYFEIEPTSFYAEKLRENSVFFKLESNENRFGTVGLKSFGDFIDGIINSFKNFKEADIVKYLGNYITDFARLKDILRRIELSNDLRTSLIQSGSIEVGLAFDKSMIGANIKDKEIARWAKSVFERYRTDVIELNYNDENEVNRIINSYNIVQRYKIYKPIIDLAFDKSIKISYHTEYRSRRFNSFFIPQEKVVQIIPKKMPDISSDEIELVNIAAVVKKGAKKLSLSDANTIFQNRSDTLSMELNNNDFKEYNYLVNLEKAIKVLIEAHNSDIILKTKLYDEEVVAISRDLKNAKGEIIDKLYNLMKEQS